MKRIVAAIITLLSGGTIAGSAAAQGICHPDIDATKSQYIVGYGSLMQKASKDRSSPTSGPNHPVEVTGYQRSWNTRGDLIGFSTTYLGVQRDEAAKMVAVIYLDINVADITGTDEREEYYCRDAVTPAQIRMLDGTEMLSDAQVWIYYNKPDAVHPPTETWPIVQSYVDIFISGCMEQQPKLDAGTLGNTTFAEECILTTQGWSPHWVNDRLYPRRPFIYQPKAGNIDRVLHKMVPDEFGAIRIE